jgi:proteasome lid subunit RPN8/RPN11
MDDIQFGDVQEAIPETSLRPDRNAHFAVVSYEDPEEREIPVFLDLDVMIDMEEHAASDTSVELGGVLLGGQFHDEEGHPFIVITDSLRAKHYESTKGSFKFTKEAWTQITQERNEYPDDLQMVGWYHTHPDWGVFLSGMDMFICDNFFNRPLDMAYVIDPCRGDRAMFQWTNDPRDRCKRQRGFYVMASRYRAQELALAVAALPGASSMPADLRQRVQTTSGGAPIINVQQPPPAPPRNDSPILMMMLTIQVCFLALIAWKLLTPVPAASTEELAKITEQLEQIAGQHEAERTHKAVIRVLDEVVAEQKGTSPGLVEKLAALEEEKDSIKRASRGYELRAKQLDEELATVTTDYKAERKQLIRERDDAFDEKKRVSETNDTLNKQLKKYKESEKDADGTEISSLWYWVGGGLAALVILGGAAAAVAYRPTNEDDLAEERLAGRAIAPKAPPPEPELAITAEEPAAKTPDQPA